MPSEQIESASLILADYDRKSLSSDAFLKLNAATNMLSLTWATLPSVLLGQLQNFPELHTLWLGGTTIIEGCCLSPKSQPKKRILRDADMSHLHELKHLRYLNISWADIITGEGLKYLQKLPLEDLLLSFINTFPVECLAYLYGMPLRKLFLEGCRQVTPFALAKLILHCPNLLFIDATGTGVTAAEAAALEKGFADKDERLLILT